MDDPEDEDADVDEDVDDELDAEEEDVTDEEVEDETLEDDPPWDEHPAKHMQDKAAATNTDKIFFVIIDSVPLGNPTERLMPQSRLKVSPSLN